MAEPQRSVLIVEDEPLIAMMVEDFLDMLGYRTAGNPDSVASALEAVAAGGFDYAILDLNLRDGERSWPVADALAAAGVPFVISTGAAGDSIEPAHRDRPVLAKPFTMDAIERAMAALG